MSPVAIDKREILKRLRAKLEADLLSFSTSQQAAQSGATHEQTRQEDPKDTRAIEAGYLARGLAERVELMQETLGRFLRLQVVDFGPEDPIAITALVALVDEAEKESIYFLVPGAAGETIEVDGATIRTLTPKSPLGQALIGRLVDDEIELDLPGGRRIATITRVG